ncbi:MAG TPA: pyridoxine 5'-phosphate synthase [Gammaproteobacteria bacterium]|nr:pyridoxine 5'-phosphate synthase [Gammaproteobacteria bacterium]
MTRLSVNLNKVALLRNARAGHAPSVTDAARTCIAAGAHGITLHPRPDARHATADDVYAVATLVDRTPGVELNVEGNPFHGLLEIVMRARPAQCTLVPDGPAARTSDHGWDLARDGERLAPMVAELRAAGVRVSLFMDAGSAELEAAKALGADRIELYTEPYAAAHGGARAGVTLARFAAAAERARSLGLGVNAGHDLTLANVGELCAIPAGIDEVSIGHALIADAFELGLDGAVRAYLGRLAPPTRH